VVKEADVAVHVSDLVRDREGQIRWAVLATFVGTGSAEPRCIEYRIRVVPLSGLGDDQMSNLARYGQIRIDMDADTERDDRTDAWNLSEVDPPAEGIPNYVFTKASQARLLEKARKEVAGTPKQYKESARALLARQAKRRRGRPPARSLDEKLAILQTAEKVFAEGGTREDVAKLHHMSTSSVRDLLGWARKDVDPPLFTSNGPSKRGGEMTDAARLLMKEIGQ
jgi:hypothetical protein